MNSVRLFLRFLRGYAKNRAELFGKRFENIKDLFVAVLVIKRGKYSTSFLNTSFLFLVFAAIIGGPIIAENNPFTTEIPQDSLTNQNMVVTYNPYENALGTIISAKPRDKTVEYQVLGGDTLASIAKKFDVSVDTVKWANNLKTEIIKPSQLLKIPPGTGIVHKVVSGDSIYSVAKKYKVDTQNIVNFPFNDFADLDTFALVPGQSLFVPDGSIQQARPTTPSYYAGPIQAGARGNASFIWPTTGSISQNPIWYHMAYDIQNPSAPPVIASDTGTVIFAGCINWGYGCHIIMDHGNGFKTLYGHLSRIDVSLGQAVGQGGQLGQMGSTGRSTGTHLHFEIRQGNTLLNPQSFLK